MHYLMQCNRNIIDPKMTMIKITHKTIAALWIAPPQNTPIINY